MATIEQMALAQGILELAMNITKQGKTHITVTYSGLVDQIDVYAWVPNSHPLAEVEGWEPSSHIVYLGDNPCTCLDPIQELQSLREQLDALLEKDADGVPV